MQIGFRGFRGFCIAFDWLGHLTCTHCARVDSVLSIFTHGASADLSFTRVATWHEAQKQRFFCLPRCSEVKRLPVEHLRHLCEWGPGTVVPGGAVPPVWLLCSLNVWDTCIKTTTRGICFAYRVSLQQVSVVACPVGLQAKIDDDLPTRHFPRLGRQAHTDYSRLPCKVAFLAATEPH
jgi:hypothetical protein